ncbi:MAG TPA: NUDIX domain-containing protein [Actinomycetales bacterium]|nr:NUDIX domain-containing protein [Actinomycetales bacterium]
MSLPAAAVATLSAWPAPTPGQEALRRGYLAHLAAQPRAVWKDGPPAHLTASCFVLDPTGGAVLLTLHGKGKFWVQFGGHCEPQDTDLAATALREAREESGVADLRLLPGPVELNRHALSEAFGRCREHLDVAYVAVAARDTVPVVSPESDDVAWFDVDDLPDAVVTDLPGRLSAVLAAVSRDAPAQASTSVSAPGSGRSRAADRPSR